MGQIHPLVAGNYGMDCEVYCAEIRFDKLLALQLPEATYVPLPKYPAVTRDLAILCREEVTVGEAEAVITQAAICRACSRSWVMKKASLPATHRRISRRVWMAVSSSRPLSGSSSR